jgi:hypothetical protein
MKTKDMILNMHRGERLQVEMNILLAEQLDSLRDEITKLKEGKKWKNKMN